MSKKRVTIEVYDAEGVLCESIGGPMDYEDLKEQMISILRNDGIPVLKQHEKHAEKADKSVSVHKADTVPPAIPPVPKFEPLLQLRWEFEGIKFDAIGKYDDVMDAQHEFLQGILEEE